MTTNLTKYYGVGHYEPLLTGDSTKASRLGRRGTGWQISATTSDPDQCHAPAPLTPDLSAEWDHEPVHVRSVRPITRASNDDGISASGYQIRVQDAAPRCLPICGGQEGQRLRHPVHGNVGEPL